MTIAIAFCLNTIYTENLNNLGPIDIGSVVTFPCFLVSVIGVNLGLSHNPNASTLYPNCTQIGKQNRARSMTDRYYSSG